jgi:hypothetical protein
MSGGPLPPLRAKMRPIDVSIQCEFEAGEEIGEVGQGTLPRTIAPNRARI